MQGPQVPHAIRIILGSLYIGRVFPGRWDNVEWAAVDRCAPCLHRVSGVHGTAAALVLQHPLWH
jgi:hypothetical protein